ncbi:MAG: serine/threonine-protein kinase [Gemmatimonadetes bacterium]|nr:serine/threonine-protein kinase [Gemmatimonadota bacterium]
MSDRIERLKSAIADRYEIEREIGQGGMATVYLADDVRHQRKVAVKVLRPDLAAALGPERFLREIEIAANLTHPHILPLLDSGEAEGFLYYVMPYIEGETLRQLIEKEGELPVTEAVRIMREVVDALAFAHSHGVVHRDIKPDNVMLSGRHAMVTDFGVAKAVSEATGRQALTTAGVALGTPAYMAPEQATADPHVDHRADIYAVGIVAYELLTGRTPFTGATPQAMLARHVSEQVEPVSKHRAHVSAELEAVVMRCLEKHPADRWQSAEELLAALEPLSTPSGGMTPTGMMPVTRVGAFRKKNTLVAIAGAIGLVVLSLVGLRVLGGNGGPVVTIGATRQLTRDPGLELFPAISPNGQLVAYAGGTVDQTHIFVRDFEGGRSIQLTDDQSGLQYYPAWSPDGHNVVFTAVAFGALEAATMTVPALGGNTRTLANDGGGAVWSPDGERVAFVRGDSILMLAVDSRQVSTVTVILRGPHSLNWSPDGRRLAYVAGNRGFVELFQLGNLAPSSIWTVAVEGGEPVRVTADENIDVSPVWTPDGRHLLFISDRDGGRDIFIVRLGRDGDPTSQPTRLTTGLDAHSLSLSADGRHAVYSEFTLRRNVWKLAIPRRGAVSISQAEQVTFGNHNIEQIAVSQDGQWLVFDTDIDGDQNIYIMPIGGGEPRQVTTNAAGDFYGDLSPDGTEIGFHSFRSGNRDVFVIPVDGGEAQQLTENPTSDQNARWSPDGKHVAFWSDRSGDWGIYLIARDDSTGGWGEPRLLVEAGSPGQTPWSPDGRFLVYNVDGGISVVSMDGSGERLLVGARSGQAAPYRAIWSRDGGTIYFLWPDERGQPHLWLVPAAGGDPRPVVRFDAPGRRTVEYSYGTDGEGFYFLLTEYESDIYTMELEFE